MHVQIVQLEKSCIIILYIFEQTDIITQCMGSSVAKGWLSMANATSTSLLSLGSIAIHSKQSQQHIGEAGCAWHSSEVMKTLDLCIATSIIHAETMHAE